MSGSERVEALGEGRAALLQGLEVAGLFAATALLLGAVGIYGVVSYGVQERLHEVGVRVALGARRGQVVRMVVGQGMGPVALGLVAGVALALAGNRILAGFLFGITTTDPASFLAAPLLLGAVALLASWLPARRATRADPLHVLNTD